MCGKRFMFVGVAKGKISVSEVMSDTLLIGYMLILMLLLAKKTRENPYIN